jgi:hypothetical protein
MIINDVNLFKELKVEIKRLWVEYFLFFMKHLDFESENISLNSTIGFY